MAKAKTIFQCSECGHETSGWLGRCPGCGSWNTLTETRINPQISPAASRRGPWLNPEDAAAGHDAASIMNLSDISGDENNRFSSGLPELDRVLGGGFVPGSLILLGGDPGIGKSTLLLQVLGKASPGTTLYVSGEESARQVRLRADRLEVPPAHIRMLAATGFSDIAAALIREKPQLAVIDSIQTVYVDDLTAAPGSVSQVREAAAGLLRIAKGQGTTIVLVGHVTKDGSIAGPRVLEHMVDTVLYFEGDRQHSYRMIRAAKNRFGATDELGLFEMSDRGLLPVASASRIFLEGWPRQVPGSVVTACMEGTRPLLIEIQALLNDASFTSPQRMAQGIDRNRLILLLAVLEKKFHFGLNNQDAYLNVVGGIRLNEPAADLAIVSALISSMKERPVRDGVLVFGEVGLSGEIRGVANADRRIMEAAQMGFQSFIVPGSCRKACERLSLSESSDLFYVDRISEALDLLFV